jgi:hypothetical protein
MASEFTAVNFVRTPVAAEAVEASPASACRFRHWGPVTSTRACCQRRFSPKFTSFGITGTLAAFNKLFLMRF